MRSFLTLPAFDLKAVHCNAGIAFVAQYRKTNLKFPESAALCFYKYWVSSSLSPNLVKFSAVLSCQCVLYHRCLVDVSAKTNCCTCRSVRTRVYLLCRVQGSTGTTSAPSVWVRQLEDCDLWQIAIR